MTQPIFVMPNHHTADCGTPPEVVGTLGSPRIYHGYFENCHGEQWIFTYDAKSGIGELKGGDAGWEEIVDVVDGLPIELILSHAEGEWLRTCWEEATRFNLAEV
jgi:hypothetical protein